MMGDREYRCWMTALVFLGLLFLLSAGLIGACALLKEYRTNRACQCCPCKEGVENGKCRCR